MSVIISCQHCIRQYAVPSELHGKIAQCKACKSTFTINATTPVDGEPVVTLIDPLVVRLNFLQSAASELIRNAVDLLRLAGQEVTKRALVRIIHDAFGHAMSRDKAWMLDCYLNNVMETAYNRTKGTADRSRADEILMYFVGHLASRDRDALDMLQGAVMGVLSELPINPPVSEPVMVKSVVAVPSKRVRLARLIRKAVGL